MCKQVTHPKAATQPLNQKLNSRQSPAVSICLTIMLPSHNSNYLITS